MKKLNLAVAVLTMGAASTAFATPTGTINFTGTLLSGTCAATVNGATGTGSQNGTTILPPMHIDSLGGIDSTSGEQRFTITLTGVGCSTTTTPAQVATPFFEADTSLINDAGRVINKGSATGVDVQLLTHDKTAINLLEPATSQQHSTGVPGTPANSRVFTYYARYYATAATVEVGTVTGSVQYSMFYK